RGVGRCEEAEEGQADLGDREEPGRVADEPFDPSGGPVSLLDELVDPGPAHRHQGDLGRDEDGLEEGEDDDDEQLEGRIHYVAGASVSGLDASDSAGPGFARGSRMRAGTPTASLPAGTSFVTTAPAPVRAPSPMSRGATIIVSTPMNAPSWIVVWCLRVPS